ncbi:MAG: 1-acyl-sn-glycerol-3-phosphate acyltransferase [Bacilli bacterium]|nr:1-acyl-sn-glycerol-3-phosphate acyltransferase [Bacilli bacterium]
MDQLEKVKEKYADHIVKIQDLYGDQDPSFLFYFLTEQFSYLLDDDPEKALSKTGTQIRKLLYPFIRLVGPLFLTNPQVIEDRNFLQGILSEDKGITLPKEPVIWASNHRLQDGLATLLAASRQGYLLVGNLPQFYNTLDSIPSWINGIILINRNQKQSRISSLEKCKKAIDYGSDVIMFPEGIINKTPHLLSLHLFPGVYKIAKEKNVKIVPIVHYQESFAHHKNIIRHIVVDDPIDVSSMSEKEALTYLRDVYAYWYYLMMEKYGRSTREKELHGFSSFVEAWENQLKNRPVNRCDSEVDRRSDYISHSEKDQMQAWEDLSLLDISPSNAFLFSNVEDAKKYGLYRFQRRF